MKAAQVLEKGIRVLMLVGRLLSRRASYLKRKAHLYSRAEKQTTTVVRSKDGSQAEVAVAELFGNFLKEKLAK